MIEQAAPLSFGQEALWLAEELVPGGLSSYVMLAGWELTGAVDAVALERALGAVVDRHEVLRCALGSGGAVVRADVPCGLRHVLVDDPALLPGAARAALRRDLDRPFDLAAPPLLHATLCSAGAARHVLVVTTHHSVWDGTSDTLFRRELAALYSRYRGGAAPDLPELAVQYGDFAAWQRDEAGELISAELAYWGPRLARTTASELPPDRPRPALRRFTARFRVAELDPALAGGVQELARAAGVTPFVVLLAAFDVVLARWSNRVEAVVGTPVSARDQPELAPLLGYFVNNVVLATSCAPGDSVTELLTRVHADVATAFSRATAPFHQVVERVNPVRDRGRHPLYQIAFQVDSEPEPLRLAGATAREISDELAAELPVGTEFDLLAAVRTRPRGGWSLSLRYAAELHDAATIDEFAACFALVLEEMIAAPWRALADLPAQPPPRLDSAPFGAIPAATPVVAVAEPGAVTDLHRRIARIWAEQLNRPQVGLDDSFFELGGSSLLAAYTARAMKAELGVELGLVDLFEADTVNGVVEFLASAAMPCHLPDDRPNR